jgi:CheY-like chemotaxis protein
VLHIDDHADNLSLVALVFEHRRDLRMIDARSGQEGLELALAHRPDLILLDLHLPDIDGGEVVRRLQNDARTRHIPVVVLSADATPAQTERLQRLGVRGYLTKPFHVRELLEAIDLAFQPPRTAPTVS